VLHVKLPHLDAWNARRRLLAQRYDEAFATLPGLVIPKTAPGNEHVWHQYVVRIQKRDQAAAFLTSRAIAYGIFYPKPLHRQPCFAQLVPPGLRLPEAERATAEVLALPIYPELSEAQQDEVIDAIREHCAAL
jgi:dTDP-4-amino-4,6-dideoxygalactose transaminase